MFPAETTRKLRTIRIFISSTFQDFKAERDALHTFVFPEIAAFCSAQGFEFEPIDLSWGISDDAVRERKTTEICLDEIDRSRRISPRLNFLFLVGNRYGWRPLPEALPKDLFDRLLGLVERDEPGAAAKIRTLYRCDDNAVPPSMRLSLPQGGPLPEAEEAAMVEAITRAAESCGAFGNHPWPGAALTEMEINRALFSGETGVRPLGLIRSLSRMPEGPSVYVDCTAGGRLDEQAFRRVEALRSRLLALPGGDVARYDLTLDETGRPGDMTGFTDRALQLLTEAVMREVQARSAEETRSSLPAGKERIDTCIGRRSEAEELIAQVEVTTTPILVTGPSGVGKSVFLTLVAEEARRRHPQWTVVEHYVGVTAASAKPDAVLRELCDGISAVRSSSSPSSGLNSAELRSRFRTLLQETKPEQPLLVLIDGLDQVLLAESTHGFDWLRGDMPPHVRLLLSATPDVVPARLPDSTVWELPGMAPGDAAELLDAYLANTRRSTGGRRRLTDAQRACMLDAYSREKLPLFLRLLVQQAAGWPSWMPPSAALPATVRSAIEEFFERLSEPNRHGAALVKWSAAYLCAARAGLSRREIMELLSQNAAIRADLKERSANAPDFKDLPDVVWSRLRFDLDPFLNEIGADGHSLMAFHSSFSAIVRDQFLDVEHNWHLASYFDGQPNFIKAKLSNRRKVAELPYQLHRTGQLERLEIVLSDPTFLNSKCLAEDVRDLAQDYRYLPKSSPIRRVGRAIEMSMQILANDPGQLATQMAGRLWDDTEPSIASFVERARRAARTPGLHPRTGFLKHPDSALLTTIAVHGEEVRGIAVSPDGDLVASAEYGQAGGGVTIWEFETRQVIGSFRCGITAPDVVRFCNGSRVLLASRNLTTSDYEVWDWKRRRKLRDLPKDLELPVELSTDGRFVLSRSADGHAIAVWDAGEDGPSATMASQEVPILAFHEANGALVTGSADGTVRLWDLDSRQEIERFHVSVDGPCRGQILSILADGRIILCETDGRRVLAVHDVRRDVLVGRPTEKKIPAWNGIKTSLNGKNHSPSIDPRLTILSVGERIVLAGYYGMDVRLWDAATGQRIALFPVYTMVGCVAAHPSLPIVLSGSQDKAVRLWAVDGSVDDWQNKGPRYSLRGIAVVGDSLLATTGSDGMIRLWDVSSMMASEVASTGASTFSICMIPGTQACVTGNDHDVVAGWDLKDGTQLFSAKTDTGGRQCMRISPDGAFLASTTARGVIVWAMDRLRAGSAEPVWTAENDAIFETLWVTADGTRLICSWDNTHVHVRDLRTGACLLDIDAFPLVEVLGTDADGAVTQQARTPDMLDWIHAVAVTPDGRYLLANSWDHSIAVWDLESGAAVHTMYGHTGTVSGIHVTPDGRYAVSVSDDQTARLWSLAEGRLLDTITCESQLLCCQILGGGRVAIGDTAGMLRVFDIEDDPTDQA